jgi:hypothetical protein
VVIERLLECGQVQPERLGIPEQISTAKLRLILEESIVHRPEFALGAGGECDLVREGRAPQAYVESSRSSPVSS